MVFAESLRYNKFYRLRCSAFPEGTDSKTGYRFIIDIKGVST